MPIHVQFLLYINFKFSFMFKRLINNAIKDLSTSAVGALAGGPDLLEGILHKDPVKIIKGASILILGLFVNSKPNRN